MNLNLLSESVLETKISDWQYADYYSLDSYEEGWSSAYLAILPRKITEDRLLAFINLVGLLAIEGEQWKKSESNVTIRVLLNFFTFGGYLSNREGHEVSIDSFWFDYIAIFNGIKNSPKASFRKNGVERTFLNLLDKDDIIDVLIFDDKWNQRLYFLKTKDNWVVFEWGTAA